MKKVVLVLFFAVMTQIGWAQARLTTAEFQKTMQPGLEIEYLFAEKTVDQAIEQKMQKAGYKGKEVKGFMMYRGIRLSEFKNQELDLYIKVERKSRKEKDNSFVTLLISSGYERFIGDTTSAEIMEQGKQFLANLLPVIEAHDLELQITDQENATEKAEKKLNGLISDGESLVKKKEKLEKEIEENKQKIEEQKAELERQKQIGTTLKAKRKS